MTMPRAGETDETVAADVAALETDQTVAAAASQARSIGPRSALTRGAVIGRYVALSKLGEGGMGVVYAGYDPELDRKVALKLVRGSAGRRGDERHARLLREAQALAKLNHPNVVSIYDVGALDGRVWIAMEYIDGRPLGAWAKERARGWREVVAVMERAGRGLAAAHAAGLLHRDFKPDSTRDS